MRPLAVLALALSLPSVAAAQYRPARPVAALTSGELSSMLSRQSRAVSGCATQLDTGAYLADVRAVVSPGPRPSTLDNARLSVTVRSRPRDPELERCVRRVVTDGLRQRALAVTRTVRAQRTYQVQERRDPPEPRPRPAWSEAEATRALRAADPRLARCLERPDAVVLTVAVDRTGRMVLQNASIEPGRELACLTRVVSSLSTRGQPGRRVRLTHRVGR